MFYYSCHSGDHSPILRPAVPGHRREAWAAPGMTTSGFRIQNNIKSPNITLNYSTPINRTWRDFLLCPPCSPSRLGSATSSSCSAGFADTSLCGNWSEEETICKDKEATEQAGERKKMRLMFLFRCPCTSELRQALALLETLGMSSSFPSRPSILIFHGPSIFHPSNAWLSSRFPCCRVFKDPEEAFISGAALEAIVHITNK